MNINSLGNFFEKYLPLLAIFIATFLFLVPESQASDVFISEFCNAYNIVTGNAGKAFAAFAIVSVGIGFFTGKVSWGLMIGVTVGIASIFGAPSIVSALSGKESFVCREVTYNSD
jgi:type IV secretory pathway VirB2 component (pilin)